MDKSNLLLTQRMMALLAKEHPSSISRFITGNNIQHLNVGTQRNYKYSLDKAQLILSSYTPDRNLIKKNVWGFYNFKGGTGKTSLCFQVSSTLALLGYKILVIDSDPQGNLSTSLGFDTSNSYLTLYDVIINKISPKNAIKEVFPGYNCIPSNISCSRFDMELTMMGRREEQFKLQLSSLKKEYDFIIFDTNPYISFVVRNVITFADMINIPCETQPYSLNALSILFDDLNLFYNTMQIEQPTYIIIPNKYEDRYGTSAEAMHVLKQNYQKHLVPNFAIRKAEDFNVAARESMPLACIAKKNSIALEDIIELTYYMLRKSMS